MSRGSSLRSFRVVSRVSWSKLLPTDQCRIVAYLDGLQAQVDELIATQEAAQTELESLLPSILDQAFKGEL